MKDQRVFSGGVFSDTIGGGRAGAEIEVTQTEIRARTPEGACFAVTYGECQLEIGGFSGRMVFCRNADRSLTIFCEDRNFANVLAERAAGVLDEQLEEQHFKKRRAARRQRRWVADILVGGMVLCIVGYYGIRAGARVAVDAVPVSVDRQIGSATLGIMDLGGPKVDDPVVVGAIEKMVDRLAPHAAIEGMEFDVHVVDSPLVNAFALPGGTIVIYTGLIWQADEAEQVAGVLAHEMAHATLRHGLERIGQSLGIAAAVNLLLGNVEGLVAAGGELFQLATVNSYSQEQENAADEEGVRMLHAAEIDPASIARFFTSLQEQQADLPDVVAWMSTHPQHEERIANVREQVGAMARREYRPLDIDWEDVRRRVEHE